MSNVVEVGRNTIFYLRLFAFQFAPFFEFSHLFKFFPAIKNIHTYKEHKKLLLIFGENIARR